MSIRSLAAAIALTIVTTAAATAPALAQTGEARTTYVRTGDLDLATDSGRTTLDRRIKRAANAVCDFGTSRTIDLVAAADECRRAALKSGRAQAQRVIVSAAQPRLALAGGGA
ncbi:MAG: UrcA family protein [Sphingomonadaceae bacterium]|nr:UrcA family protein [Sphingomonadaceae bacterium]